MANISTTQTGKQFVKSLGTGYLKKEMEGFIMAAQDQAIRTNAIKARIDKTSSDSKCRLCKVKEVTIDNLVGEQL